MPKDLEPNLKLQHKTGFTESKNALGRQTLSQLKRRLETQPAWSMGPKLRMYWQEPDHVSQFRGCDMSASSSFGSQVLSKRTNSPNFSMRTKEEFVWAHVIRRWGRRSIGHANTTQEEGHTNEA